MGQSPKVLVISKGGHITRSTILRMISLHINNFKDGGAWHNAPPNTLVFRSISAKRCKKSMKETKNTSFYGRSGNEPLKGKKIVMMIYNMTVNV